ncbi:hypothetical protein THOM_1569 [Trachipleistophora hominis]|uniref:Uncharacterized protein n=1 Tax=Trachipleistophora hominis TaxID=72359 RepID=L7JW28_TRAHO|nr:hypothetical protein THOM_1569 [Trachipleistophora hominis]
MLFTLQMYKIPRNMNKMSFLDIINKRVSDPMFQCNFVNDSGREVFLSVAYLMFKNKTQKGYESA